MIPWLIEHVREFTDERAPHSVLDRHVCGEVEELNPASVVARVEHDPGTASWVDSIFNKRHFDDFRQTTWCMYY